MNTKKIDIFLHIIDNLGDMGFVAEFLYFFKENFPWQYNFIIYTNDVNSLFGFFEINKLQDFVEIRHTDNLENPWQMAISFFHTTLPYHLYEKILRVDYLSFDEIWLKNNLGEHIFSSPKHRILEFIPSPKLSGAGLLPKISSTHDRQFFTQKFRFGDVRKKWISCFCYADTAEKIDFQNIPKNVEVFVFGVKNSRENFGENVHKMPFMHFTELYNFLENSDYIITRGEVSFSQVLQMWKPFLWDLYHEIGGFPTEQSEDFLEFLNADENYKNFCQKFWHQNEKITISEIIEILENSKNIFTKRKYKNFCEEMKKFLDNSENFI